MEENDCFCQLLSKLTKSTEQQTFCIMKQEIIKMSPKMEFFEEYWPELDDLERIAKLSKTDKTCYFCQLNAAIDSIDKKPYPGSNAEKTELSILRAYVRQAKCLASETKAQIPDKIYP